MAGIQDHLATKMVCIQIYSILRQNDMGVCKFCIQNRLVFVFKTGLSVEIMHFNQAFCSNWQHFSQQEKNFLRLSSLCFLNSDLHLACVWNCLCWHNAAVNSRVATFLQLNCFKWFPMSLFGQHLLLCLALLVPISFAFICLKAFWRSNYFVWIVSLRLIPLNLKVSKVSFIADKQDRQILTPVTSNVVHQALQVLPTLLYTATLDVCCCAAQSP